MTRQSSGVRRADGLTPSLRIKAQKRRETQSKLAEISGRPDVRRNDPTPLLDALRLPIGALKPASRRVRRSDKAQAARLEASIATFGQVLPILVDAEDRIVHGHGVFEALKRVGAEDVSVIRITHLPTSQVRALAITLNRLGETGSWDEDALKLEFVELMDLGEDPVLTGFEVAEIDALLVETDEDEVEIHDEGVAQPSATSRPGDTWRLGRHMLHHGDALRAESYRAVMCSDEQARVVLADPPYNVPNFGHTTSSSRHREFLMAAGEMSREQFKAFLGTWLKNAMAYVTDGGLFLVFMDWRSIETLLTAGRELELNLLNIVVWSKTNGGQGSLWRSKHELIAVFKKGNAPHTNHVALGRWGRWRSNVWEYPGGSSIGSDTRADLADHPTPKPRALLEDALLDISDPSEIVIDSFLGSGSTLLAAETTGRICRAIELDGAYCDLSIARWQSLTGHDAILQETGETFRQASARRAAIYGAPERDSPRVDGDPEPSEFHDRAVADRDDRDGSSIGDRP